MTPAAVAEHAPGQNQTNTAKAHGATRGHSSAVGSMISNLGGEATAGDPLNFALCGQMIKANAATPNKTGEQMGH